MKNLIFSFVFLFSFSLHAGEIMTTADFSLIEEETLKLSKNALVLFDVDATLIVADDALLKPKGKSLFKKLISNFAECDRDLFREIRMHAPHSIVDNRSIRLVRDLQQKGIPVLAFTSAAANIKNSELGEWRVKELRGYGFDFGIAFEHLSTLSLPKNPEISYCPMYNSGVLYSSLHPKGDILTLFLKKINCQPEKVIFVDDELEQVQCVVEAMDKQGIPCLGIHYTAVDEMVAELDIDQASFQVNYFVKNNVWVCDYNAKDCRLCSHKEIAMLPQNKTPLSGDL